MYKKQLCHSTIFIQWYVQVTHISMWWCIVHVNVIFFLYFWHVLKNVLLLLLIHHFIMCNVFVMCNLSYIDNSMQSITEGTCFSLKYFSFCILLVITWSTFIFLKNYFFFCDSPVQLTSVLLCHNNILPVSKYLTYFFTWKKVFYNWFIAYQYVTLHSVKLSMFNIPHFYFF